MSDSKKRKTIVIGHKNPDTDSICSAICYANLKRILTGEPGTSILRPSTCWTILGWKLRS